VHLDVDVLDPAEVQTNEYQPDGGLSERQILEALDDIGRTLRIRAAGIASYDPAPILWPRDQGRLANHHTPAGWQQTEVEGVQTPISA
jgi:arginase family enzyme